MQCIHTCIHTCVHTCIHTCIQIYIYIYTYVHMYASMYVFCLLCFWGAGRRSSSVQVGDFCLVVPGGRVSAVLRASASIWQPLRNPRILRLLLQVEKTVSKGKYQWVQSFLKLRVATSLKGPLWLASRLTRLRQLFLAGVQFQLDKGRRLPGQAHSYLGSSEWSSAEISFSQV